MFSRSFKRVGLHYTAFRNAIREDSRQTAPSRGVSPRKKFAVEANVESRANCYDGGGECEFGEFHFGLYPFFSLVKFQPSGTAFAPAKNYTFKQ